MGHDHNSGDLEKILFRKNQCKAQQNACKKNRQCTCSEGRGEGNGGLLDDQTTKKKIAQNRWRGHDHCIDPQRSDPPELEQHCLKRQGNQDGRKGPPPEDKTDESVKNQVNARNTDGHMDQRGHEK